MAKIQIEINDFDLFCEMVKSTAKVVESATFIVGENGIEMYGANMDARSRCEFLSNSVVSKDKLSFSIEKLQTLIRVLASIREIHENDYSGLRFSYDAPFLRFESKKFKTKLSTCQEDTIRKWVSKKIDFEMRPVFEFVSNSDMIKRVNGQSFMFSDPKDVRVYLETKSDMENNAVFATVGNKETELNNEITLKFGLVTSGSLLKTDNDGLVSGERSIIIDLVRLNLFNAVTSRDIRFQLMDVNCLVGKSELSGKNGTFFKTTVYGSLLKA